MIINVRLLISPSFFSILLGYITIGKFFIFGSIIIGRFLICFGFLLSLKLHSKNLCLRHYGNSCLFFDFLFFFFLYNRSSSSRCNIEIEWWIDILFVPLFSKAFQFISFWLRIEIIQVTFPFFVISPWMVWIFIGGRFLSWLDFINIGRFLMFFLISERNIIYYWMFIGLHTIR